MDLIILEIGNLGGLIAMMLCIMLVPPLVLAIIAWSLSRSEKKNAAKVFYILATIYLIIGLGICGGLMGGF